MCKANCRSSGATKLYEWGLLPFRNSGVSIWVIANRSTPELLEKCLSVEKVPHVLPVLDLFLPQFIYPVLDQPY